MLTVPTTCPFCACGCGSYLLVNRGHLVGVAPSENHPVSHGRLCARGWCAHEAPLWGKRLQHPLIRRDGKSDRVSWDTALDHLAHRIKELLDAGKPIGVLGSARATNEENYLAAKLARAGFRSNDVDFCYHTILRPLLEGIEEVAGHPTSCARMQDIESSQTILLVEGDLAQSHPQAASCVLRALEKSARLITIGCRRTQMARLATLHFETAPGDEGGVIDGLMTSAVRLARTSGLGSEAEVGTVHLADKLCHAAEWIAGAERAVFLIPPAIGPREQSRRDAAALASLAAITGHLKKPGSGLLPLLARSNARGACDMGVAADRLPGYRQFSDRLARQGVESLWRESLPADPGLEAEEIIESVSGLIVLADDPASVLPVGQRAASALRNLEFLAVLDSFFTPAVELAHLVLPIASFAECEGTVTNLEGRIQRLRPAADAPGEARPGWQVLAELCPRFGVRGTYKSCADVLREIAQAAPGYGRAEQALAEGWSNTLVTESDGFEPVLQARARSTPAPANGAYLLAHEDAYDWSRDPLVMFSPTLSRDSRSERKLFPGGLVEICQQDADTIGVHGGRRVKLTSEHGEATVPVRLREGIKPGVLLVPYAFRDHVASVLGRDGIATVRVEQA